jgi:DNA-binding SARP family transcriptional activator
VEFRLLGPLEVLGDDGSPVPLGGARARALLAQLLLHPNEAVSTDRLIDGVWGESPPSSAAGALQGHVHALRKALGADRILTRPPGYLVQVEETELDVLRFERLLAGCRGDCLVERLRGQRTGPRFERRRAGKH